MTDTSCFQSNELFRGTKNRAETCAASLMVCAGNGQIFLTNKTPLKKHIK